MTENDSGTLPFESPEQENARLREENARLRRLLVVHSIAIPQLTPANPPPAKTAEMAPVDKKERARKRIALFQSLFRGWEDVYARRWENADGRSGYVPAAPAAIKYWRPINMSRTEERKKVDQKTRKYFFFRCIPSMNSTRFRTRTLPRSDPMPPGGTPVPTQDIPQNFIMSFQAPLPFGKGQRWMRQGNPVLGAVVGGWQLNGIFSRQSGYPLGLTAPNATGSLGGGRRPNSTGKSAALAGPVAGRLNRYFDTAQFTQPAPFTFGNVARTLPDVRRPSLTNLDLSLFKNFALREALQMQVRAEAFNISNTPIFGPPGTGFASPAFGVIAGQGNGPRQVQLALRLDF